MTKPPIGLRPKSNYLEDRRNEVYEAMVRYRESGKEIPQHWIIEYIDIKLNMDKVDE